ncbi:methyl-accepting chemotaxis protein [Sporosarcina aquimarina]|uniref:Methyl-accepting chemotaxis protein n=1 Tax=Sporosarcina aquimarina TaxID=114975 RepID=A0ABU4G532_9BACL|nr:methyl-accepting chemotaxis protein [Sporosarcina aquimarina]MDW0110752.1 methyl-accepting chemotaxis protein [Sporosarcina aquimarina]
MSIGKKLGAGFGIIVLIILISTTWSRFQLGNIQDEYTDLLETNVALSILSKTVEAESALQGQSIRSYLLRGDGSDLDLFEEQHKHMEDSLDSMAAIAVTAEMKEKVESTQELSKQYYASAEELISLVKGGDVEEATAFLESNLRPINVTIREKTAEMANFQNDLLAKGNVNVQKTADRAQIYSIIAGALSLVLSILIAVYLTRNITRPLKRLSSAVTVVANGDLTEDDVSVSSKDEVAALAHSFNIMKGNLRNLIGGVNSNALHLTASAEELSASTYEVSQSSEDMAKSIESVAQGAQVSASAAGESSIAMEETAVGVQRIAESAVELNTSAEETMRIANESGKTIETAKSQMDLIYQTSHETSSLIQRLSRQTEEIESITSVITGITEQTNLLALNAAIEAARAGEHGKGFAVVADEVRKLAEESKKSAGQIVQLTMAIQSDTKDVEQSVTESMQNVEQGVAVIDNAGRTFVEIVQAVQTMTNQITEISAATEQISASAEEVSASVSEISGQAASASIQTEQNSASMEEQMATIEEINAVAQDLSVKAVELQEMIQQFTV